MASVGTGVFVAMGGVSLACVLQSLKCSGQADMKKSTALCATANTYVKGLTERTVSGTGFFKASATTAEDTNGLFQAALTSTTNNYLLLFGRDGGTNGAVAELFNVMESKYEVNSVVGEIVATDFEAKATKTDTAENYQIGVFLFNQTVTGSTNGTSYDSTTGGTGYLIQVHVLAGDGTAAVTVQHSTNNSTWADLVASATYANNSATQLRSTSTSVNRYVRIVAAPNTTTNLVAVGMKVGFSG